MITVRIFVSCYFGKVDDVMTIATTAAAAAAAIIRLPQNQGGGNPHFCFLIAVTLTYRYHEDV